jgi:hypothetical protein
MLQLIVAGKSIGLVISLFRPLLIASTSTPSAVWPPKAAEARRPIFSLLQH